MVGCTEFSATRLLLKDIALAICTPSVSVSLFSRLWQHYKVTYVLAIDLNSLFDLILNSLSHSNSNSQDTPDQIESSFVALTDKMNRCSISYQNFTPAYSLPPLNALGSRLMNWLIISQGVLFSSNIIIYKEWTRCLEDDAFLLHLNHYSTQNALMQRMIYWVIALKRCRVLEQLYDTHPQLFLQPEEKVLKIDFLNFAILSHDSQILNFMTQKFKLPDAKIMSSFHSNHPRINAAYSWRGREKLNLFDVATTSGDLDFLNQVQQLVKPSRKVSFVNFVHCVMRKKETETYKYSAGYIVGVLNILVERGCIFNYEGISRILSLIKYFPPELCSKYVTDVMDHVNRVPKHQMTDKFRIKL